MSSLGLAGCTSKEMGDRLETALVDRIDPFERVSDDDVTWHDARTTAPMTASERLPMRGLVVVVPAGTPVEIKGARLRISDGASTRRGRFYVKKRAHDRLQAAAGVYLLAVYCTDTATSDPVRARLVVLASALEVFEPSWSAVDDTTRTEQEVAKLPWSAVFDPTAIEPEEGSP